MIKMCCVKLREVLPEAVRSSYRFQYQVAFSVVSGLT